MHKKTYFFQEFGTVLVEGTEVSRLAERLKASESLCEELVEENEVLKADIKDLQQEIEEMQVIVSLSLADFFYMIINYLPDINFRLEKNR